jgi:hypothetical protein
MLAIWSSAHNIASHHLHTRDDYAVVFTLLPKPIKSNKLDCCAALLALTNASAFAWMVVFVI